MKKNDPFALATPEWATAVRDDRRLDESLTGGWVATPAPLGRGSSFTDFGSHLISVPEGDSELARGIRFHELTHARFSPSTVPSSLMTQMNVSSASVRVAEEFRINHLATTVDYWWWSHKGLNQEQQNERREMCRLVRGIADGTEAAAADHAVAQDDFRSAVYLMFSTYRLDSFRTVKRRLRRKPEWKNAIGGIADFLDREYGGVLSTRNNVWSGTRPYHFQWREGFAEREVILPEGFVSTTLPIAQLIDTIVEEGGVGNDKIERDSSGATMKPEEGKKEKGRSQLREYNTATWCALRMGMTSLTETTTKFIGRRKRPSVTGKIPSRPDRLLTDPERRIFRTEVRGDGGIVVFDCSGSMSVDYDTVRNAVAQFAGATVLAYTHTSRDKANCWVLAKNGRMVSEEEMNKLDLNNGNGVDGLALRWAIRERRTPKDFILWVCDLGVTGTHDAFSQTLLADCAELCRKHNIAQVYSTEEALELLAEMKRTGVMPRRRWTDALATVINKLETGRLAAPAVSIDTQA